MFTKNICQNKDRNQESLNVDLTDKAVRIIYKLKYFVRQVHYHSMKEH